jgi:hypothetical protein
MTPAKSPADDQRNTTAVEYCKKALQETAEILPHEVQELFGAMILRAYLQGRVDERRLYVPHVPN